MIIISYTKNTEILHNVRLAGLLLNKRTESDMDVFSL